MKENKMVKLFKLITSEEVIGYCTRKGSTIYIDKPCAIMLISSKSTPDQHSMALIPYAAYAKDHKIEIEKRQVVWEAELEDDVLNQYNMLFGSGIQIVSGEIPRNIPSTSQLNIVNS
jgi:hypothetical protein